MITENVSFKGIADELSIKEFQVRAVAQLHAQGFTIPFIARYRKEQTSSLDEVKIEYIIEAIKREENLISRKKYIAETLGSDNLLTNEILDKLNNCKTLEEAEDIYLPFKKQRKTLADIAIEKGLEPLARMLLQQNNTINSVQINDFLKNQKIDLAYSDAIDGCIKIAAKWINENLEVRKALRELFREKSNLSSKVVSSKIKEAQNFQDYFEFSQSIIKIPAHRLLAILKGEEEDYLKVKVEPESSYTLKLIRNTFINHSRIRVGIQSEFLELAIKDSYKRLLHPSIEKETINFYKAKADEVSIEVFAQNLKQILLTAPIPEQPILAIDPGFRSGCKIVVLSSTGELLVNETVFPFEKQKEAISKILNKIEVYKISTIAIGNGKGGRELQTILERLKIKTLNIVMVNESGASVYSASAAAREEFPTFDITVRGAISIGRRLQNPMAELVKIDPKSIGVGQYQHLVNQKLLNEKLDQVISVCVNKVGVNLNNASKYLLKYVSGINESIATKILEFRKANGRFSNRKQLLEIDGLGENKFTLSAGFLKVEQGDDFLDSTRIHPENYGLVRRIEKDLGLKNSDLEELKVKILSIDKEKYFSDSIGAETINDIIEEINNPGKDIRRKNRKVNFNKSISSINQLQEGMELEGIVTNVTAFGCFVDIGVQINGLIHVSKLSQSFISDPNEIISINQIVLVKIISVEIERKRIQLELISISN